MRKEESHPGSEAEPGAATTGAALDLACLCSMHLCLPGDMAGVMVVRAALGLQRNKHSPGARLQMAIDEAVRACVLVWPAADIGTAKQHDQNRITEDGAEAIALAVAHRAKAWRVVRRMQREEHADWLLEDQDKGVRKLVAFEVSGIDRGSVAGRLREKLDQVAKSIDVDQRWAGVVGFQEPEATIRPAEVRTHGH